MQLPVAFHAHENGVFVTFSRPLDRDFAERPNAISRRPGTIATAPPTAHPSFPRAIPGPPGHDPLTIRSAHVLADGRTLFLEIPDLQPVNQLHLHLRPDAAGGHSTFSRPSTAWRRPSPGSLATNRRENNRRSPDPRRYGRPFAQASARTPGSREFKDAAQDHDRGRQEPELHRPLVQGRSRRADPADVRQPRRRAAQLGARRSRAPGTVGDLANKIIAEPDAVARHYVPKTDDVLAYTDIVRPGDQFVDPLPCPRQPGRYPYLCTFPGHWMVMNGEMIVE